MHNDLPAATITGVTVQFADSRIRAVLGPTNTGKTHLAIERMCAHSSGAIGFPLRLLAREVYDKVCQIKGRDSVALITGEERIEPPGARWFLCTAEAMPAHADLAFMALDEAQLAADPERGHIYTAHLLHARGREETMLLGAATLEPAIKALLPEAEIISRPRFSTLSHAGSVKLSRLPPRSAVVAFSAEQVYAAAEMLRRFRGGAAVVMGALSPETRNRQVELFQAGEVDYIVATDAIGMGLNLDVSHVAFAGLSKYDGKRQRRLTPAEMAQIAGRAGRHQRDGTFGTLSGGLSGRAVELDEDEVTAIEEHHFAPLTRLFWRQDRPRFDTLHGLIADLEEKPSDPWLAPAPEAIDLAVLKLLADEPATADIRGRSMVKRFWQVCSLPDFRQQGAETHARFVARLWQDLRHGYLGSDFVAARIAELDNTQGDIHALQGRIAAIRSWSYMAQRPDWVLAREEMAARAKAVETRLSDALHTRLTERFVNRRTAVLMKALAKDPRLLRVCLEEDDVITVEGMAIGHLDGLRFIADPGASHADRKLLLAAAERHLPNILKIRAQAMIMNADNSLELNAGAILRDGQTLAHLSPGRDKSRPRIEPAAELKPLAPADRDQLMHTITTWLEALLIPLAPLRRVEEAVRTAETGTEVRALLLRLIDGCGVIARKDARLHDVPAEKRAVLRRHGVTIGTLDIFMPALLKPAARRLLAQIGADKRPVQDDMAPVIPARRGALPAGYRYTGEQAIRVDLAEKLIRNAHEQRNAANQRHFRLALDLATSMGLTLPSTLRLLHQAGFQMAPEKPLAADAFGPPAPRLWNWHPPRSTWRQRNRNGKKGTAQKPASSSAFAELAQLIR